MAIRVFINTWSENQISQDRLRITDPIDEYLANISLSAPVVSNNYYGKIALNKRPDRSFLLKIMEGNLTDSEWNNLNALANVTMIPPHAFDLPITAVKNNIKNQIYAALDSLGISRTLFDSAATVGGFLRNVLIDLNDDEVGFGAYELTPESWA